MFDKYLSLSKKYFILAFFMSIKEIMKSHMKLRRRMKKRPMRGEESEYIRRAPLGMKAKSVLFVIFVGMVCFVSSGPSVVARSAKREVCPKPVPVLTSLSGVTSFYRPTATQSKIDWNRYNDYLTRTWQFDALLKRLPKFETSSNCLIIQLKLWADAGALTQDVSPEPGEARRQAIMLQAWTSVAVTTAIIKYQSNNNATISVEVLNWLDLLGESIYREFTEDSDRPEWLNRFNNHRIWAGLAVLRIGLLLNKEKFIKFGLGVLDEAFLHTDENGAFKSELRRGDRAVHYLNFALLPTAGLIDSAYLTGRRLNDEEWKLLSDLARTTLSLTINPAGGSVTVDLPQKMGPLAEELAWLPLLHMIALKRDPEFAAELERSITMFGPFLNRFYGCPTGAYNYNARYNSPQNPVYSDSFC